jgi:nicotinamide riboside kinase
MVRTIEGTTVRIGISGAQSVGKTTLLNALRSEKCFKDYAVRNEVTRGVKALGVHINEHGSDISQQLIMKEHIYNLVMFDDMVTDRTALDGIVYTRWLHEQGKVSDECYAECSKVFHKIISQYDYMFYIRPEFPIEDDGVRSASQKWQDEIVELFDKFIQDFELKVINVSGSVRERVNTILKTIGEIE